MSLKDLPYSAEEMRLISEQPLTDAILVEVLRTSTAGLSWFGYDVIEPLFKGVIGLNDRELAVGMTFYRMLPLLKTTYDLGQPYHFQSIAGATRAIFELAADITLLCDGTDEDIERFHAHTRVSRFRNAQKQLRFYEEHPELDGDGESESQRQLLETPGLEAELEVLCHRLWKKSLQKLPFHWSGSDMGSRAGRLGPEFKELYLTRWSLLSWYMHGGGAGVGGFPANMFTSVAALCRDLLKDVVPEGFRRVGVLLHLHRAMPDFFEKLEFAQRYVQAIALAEAKLRALGRPGRFDSLATAIGDLAAAAE